MAGRRQFLITRITHPTAELVEESSPSGCKGLEMNSCMGYSSTGMRDIEFEVALPERLYNCLADAMRKELWWGQYHELTLIVFNFSNNDYFSWYVLQLLYTERQ